VAALILAWRQPSRLRLVNDAAQVVLLNPAAVLSIAGRTHVTDATKPRPNFPNIAFLSVTFLVALVGAPWYIFAHGLGWPEVITCVALWLAVGISVTAGYHRLFTHKTYQAAWPVRLSLLVFGAAAFENSVINWAADHRIHHSNVDHERDPYNIQRGFWWAHIGWIFYENEPISQTVVQDLLADPLVRWQHRWYKELGAAVAFGIPLVVGLATGRVLGCLLIGGVLRVVISHHGTFFINSLCHMVGRQPYSRDHSARDSAVMAALAFGEGYHNYHHSFPFDYRNGIRPWQFDPAKWVIFGLFRLGLVRNLRRASDAAILKAKVDVQFETAKEKVARVAGLAREGYQQRLQEGYSILQLALHDLLALQRRPAREAAAADDLPRVGMVQRALEQALREWKETLRQLNRLSRAAA
jgi:stearoyl-CoA desaturase (Delta-9 desaturase)